MIDIQLTKLLQIPDQVEDLVAGMDSNIILEFQIGFGLIMGLLEKKATASVVEEQKNNFLIKVLYEN